MEHAREMSGISDVRVIDLPKVADPRGNLTFVENGRHVPFDIRRVFYLYDVPGGETRAGHANKELQQVLVAASGSFDVVLDDGNSRQTWSLSRPYCGLYVPGMLWRELRNFSSGSVCLVMCSEFYDADDYYRDYDEFCAARAQRSS
jgi:dTDP-4-dehydrorhamnose 3,5-epimerase-like enzyme